MGNRQTQKELTSETGKETPVFETSLLQRNLQPAGSLLLLLQVEGPSNGVSSEGLAAPSRLPLAPCRAGSSF